MSTSTFADPWRRLLSAVYESILLFGLYWFFGYLFSTLTSYKGEPGLLMPSFQLFVFLLFGTYFTWFWSLGRRTLPMKTCGITLVDRQGRALSTIRAAGRYAAAYALFATCMAATKFGGAIFLLMLPIPFVWALFHPERATLYDVIAGTRLVPKAPEARGLVGH
jgi:uncharacterized RDD family membrane protein YckC